MAFGRRESNDPQGGSFVRHIGIGLFEIAAINPNEKEYETLFGRAPQKELNYVKDKDDRKTANITVWLRNVTGGQTSEFLVPVTFFLDNIVNEYEGSVKVIDKYGIMKWIPKENYSNKTVPEKDDKGRKVILDKGFRACSGDEDLLISMIKALRNIDRPDEYDKENHEWKFKSEEKIKGCEALLDHVKDYFKGDFSELKNLVKEYPHDRFLALIGIDENGREVVFKFCFEPSWVTNFKNFEYWLGSKKEKKYPNTTFKIAPLEECFPNTTPQTPTDLTDPKTLEQVTQEDDELPF